MGRKDIGLKAYFQDATRYADLWNGGVFQGRQIVKADELQEVTPVHFKLNGETTIERTGDLVMMQSYDGQKFAILALENQDKVDYGMPARIIVQEALEYDRQMREIQRSNGRAYRLYCEAENREELDGVYKDAGEYMYRFRKEDRLSPVVTLIVYWGEEKWKGAKSLHEMIDFGGTQTGKELRNLVPEYPLHFLDLSRFKHCEYFQSELRPLLELFQKREQRKGEGKRMCKALDDLIAEGRLEGELEGKAEFVLDLLEEYGVVPDSLKETILKQTDISVLKKWHKLAARARSIDEFVEKSCLRNFCE